MHAIANTEQLVADGIITSAQATTIEARARETMVYLAINSLLCLGISAATGGFILWLGSPASVAATGLMFLGGGTLILLYGSALYRMFGNAASLIGAGMLIGGASIELMTNYSNIAGEVMTAAGLIIAAGAAWALRSGSRSIRFLAGAALLMGLAMHLTGLNVLLERQNLLTPGSVPGYVFSGFYLYATAGLVLAGWLTDVRLVTALAIVPFAQTLDTGSFYFDAAYVFYSPESTLSILQMTALIALGLWLAARWPERLARHARVLAVMGFIVANLCALVGSLWGDWIGETLWGPGYMWWRETDMTYQQWQVAQDKFEQTAIFLSASLYSVLWAIALAVLVLWSANKAQRGLFNSALTFAGIHLYTQVFESFYDEPLAYVIGGIAAIPLAWAMWRLDHWIVAKRGSAQPA